MLRKTPLAALLLLSILLSGCPSAQTPERTARAWLEALAEGRADDAWGLLSAEQRRSIPLPELRRRVASLSENQRRELALRAKSIAPGRLVAEWTVADSVLRLEHRGGKAWVVSGPLPRLSRQDTPIQALRTFARAFRGRDYGTLLGLAPDVERSNLNEDKLAQALDEPEIRSSVEAALGALLDSGGGEANGEAGWIFRAGRHRADLRRELGRWHLVDIR